MGQVTDLIARITARSGLHAAFLNRAVAGLSAAELADLDGYLGHCLADGRSLDRLADDYKLVVDDTLREQVYFRRHGRYRFSRFEEVAAAVYLDDRYMTAYMRGLALTAFFWPNHAAIRRYFHRVLPRAGRGRYLEVGPGHGFYFLAALRSGAFEACEGIDISPSSVALTERLLAGAGFSPGDACRLRTGDFLLAEDLPASFQMVAMGEVLEHVERPDLFLARARELTREDSMVFVTTCIDSPACDHIFLFTSVEQIEALARDAGLRVEDRLVLPYEGTTLDESRAKRLAVNVAMVLRHA